MKKLSLIALLAILLSSCTLFNKAEEAVVVDDGQQVACQEDAKVCPDGSSVGREGPNCEFPACPGEEAETDTETGVETGEEGNDDTLKVDFNVEVEGSDEAEPELNEDEAQVVEEFEAELDSIFNDILGEDAK